MALISTLTDDFTAGTLNAQWGVNTSGAVSAVTINAGRCKLVAGTAANSNSSIVSNALYDHTNGSSFMQIESFGAQPTGWDVRLLVGVDDNNIARLNLNAGTLTAEIYNGGVQVFNAATVASDAVSHRWLKIRHQSFNNTWHFETSPDGITWTDNYNSGAHSWGVTALAAGVQVITLNTNTAPGAEVYVDNFNVPPVTTPAANKWSMFFFRGIPTTTVVGPPSGTGTPIAALSDLTSAWIPNHVTPASTNAHFQTISTPSGPGWQMIADENDIAPWDSNTKAIFARKDGIGNAGTTELYTFNVFFPTQTWANTWHTGLLAEWHTPNSSGHYLGTDMNTGTPRFRIARNLDNYEYEYFYGPNVVLNTWIPISIEIKWATTSAGYYRVDINGTRYVNFTGATAYAGDSGATYLQFGWYSNRGFGLTNTVRFGNLRRLVT